MAELGQSKECRDKNKGTMLISVTDMALQLLGQSLLTNEQQ